MNKLYVLAAASGLLITTAAVSLTASAATSTTPRMPRFEEQRGMMQTIDSGNYDEWKASMEERITTMRQHADELEKNISQETFNKLVQVHQLMKEGKIDEAKALRSELGEIGFGLGGPGRGMHRQMMLGASQ